MILGISGKIGSGKDTVGKIIQHLVFESKVKTDLPFTNTLLNNSGFQIKKFADKLKDIVCLLIGCTREQLEDQKFKNTELGEEWWYWENSFGKRINYLDNTTYGSTAKDGLTSRKLIKLTPRLLLQLLGTECGRNIIHPNIWVNALMSEYKECKCATEKYIVTDCWDSCNYPDEGSNWIITDVRFPNELEAVKKRAGITIRVHKGSGIHTPKIEDLHPSETALDNAEFNYHIDNSGTIEELIERVKEILILEKII